MFKHIVTAGLLSCFATMGSAASFTYSSSSVDELEYFSQFVSSGGLLSDGNFPFRQSGSSLVFQIDENIRKNRTYTFNFSDVYSGRASGQVSITTGADRQVVDWNIDVEINRSVDSFNWDGTPAFESSNGFYEYLDADCFDLTGDDDRCLSV